MKIGIDVTCWPNQRGYGRFTRQLVTAMARVSADDEFVLFIDAGSRLADKLSLPRCQVVEVATKMAPSQAASASGSRSPADVFRMSAAVRRSRPDVLFFPSVYTWFPSPIGIPSVVTIHDAIAERFPEIVTPGLRARALWALKTKLAILQARQILTVSEYSKQDISRVHSIPLDRLTVTGEAPSEVYQPGTRHDSDEEVRRLGIDPQAGWFVYVGGLSPHKDVPNLIRAYARFARELPHPPALILVGPGEEDVFHGERDRVVDEIRSCEVGHLVTWAGYLSDESLRHVLSGAHALVLPSRCEGFGLPAVEAAACGTAVIATIESPLPRLLEGGGIFVAPGDEDALFLAMRTIECDAELRSRLGAVALARARELSWDAAARVALETIYRAA